MHIHNAIQKTKTEFAANGIKTEPISWLLDDLKEWSGAICRDRRVLKPQNSPIYAKNFSDWWQL